MYFRYFAVISKKRLGPSFQKKILSHKNALCQYGWNWPSDSGEETENIKKFTTIKINDENVQILIREAH